MPTITTSNPATKALIDAGAVKPVIGRTFPMARTAAAYEELAHGDSAGKIVVTVS